MSSSFDQMDGLLDASLPAEESSTPKPIVLVVDDDEGMRDTLLHVLSQSYRVVTAGGGKEALDLLDEAMVCVVLDVRMSEMDGFATCSAIQERLPWIPVVFHSAYQAEKDPFEIINSYHPFAYLTKDGDLQRLVGVVAEAVDHAAQAHAPADVAPQHATQASVAAAEKRGAHVMTVGPQGYWFQIAEATPVDFRRRGPMRRILLKLVEHHLQTPGGEIDVHSLIDAAWRGTSIQMSSALERFYTTMSRLRALGLRNVIERGENGYCIRPDVLVVFSERRRRSPTGPVT